MAAKAKKPKQQQSTRRSVKVDPQLHTRLKEYAQKTGRLLEFVTDRAIEQYLDDPRSETAVMAPGQ